MDTGILLRTFSLTIILVGLHACHPRPGSPVENSGVPVDSLIQDHWINAKTYMVSFGAEAITAIHTQKGIVVIDAGISTGLTQKYRRRIEQVFKQSPFTHVINTHAHHDHYRGNTVFPEAQVVGHENGPGEMVTYWKAPEQVAASLEAIADEYKAKLHGSSPDSEEYYHNLIQHTRYQSAYQDARKKVPIRKPDLVFQDSLHMDMGDITLELKYFGSCHSSSDILVYIPELKILFAGDLMFQYGRPSIRDQNMTDRELWKKAICWSEKRMDKIETVIGGHGQVLTRDDLQAFHRNLSEKML
jgi:glyoxylase-like metal-dependent hydrolase (beta-lactamase superfamily II)